MFRRNLIPGWVGIVMLSGMFLMGQETWPTFEVVDFPDPNLEAVVREAIDKPVGSIYAHDLLGLEVLVAYDRNISDLTGLEYCVDLRGLYLDFNQISSLSPLAALTGLTSLTLAVNPIVDISPLTVFDVSYEACMIAGGPHCDEFPRTEILDCGNNQISGNYPDFDGRVPEAVRACFPAGR